MNFNSIRLQPTAFAWNILSRTTGTLATHSKNLGLISDKPITLAHVITKFQDYHSVFQIEEKGTCTHKRLKKARKSTTHVNYLDWKDGNAVQAIAWIISVWLGKQQQQY